MMESEADFFKEVSRHFHNTRGKVVEVMDGYYFGYSIDLGTCTVSCTAVSCTIDFGPCECVDDDPTVEWNIEPREDFLYVDGGGYYYSDLEDAVSMWHGDLEAELEHVVLAHENIKAAMEELK